MPLKTALLFLLLPFTLAQRPTPTPLYINQVPAYSSLPSCAERPLSTIVRGMARGCGDHNAVTSYDCFCTSSSSFFSSVISSSVAEECGAAASVEAALGVFGEYCALRAGGAMVTSAVSSSHASEVSATAAGVASQTPSRSSIAPIPSKTSGTGRGGPAMEGILLVGGVVISVMLGRML